jgi:hypothetical protein
MWFRRKKPVRKKRNPKEWTIPKDQAIEIISLYDDMMQAAALGIASGYIRKLPQFLFWKKVVEAIPDVRGHAMRIESSGDRFCIKIVEIVGDDDYEPERETTNTEDVLYELEDKLNQESCKPSPGLKMCPYCEELTDIDMER